MANYLGIDLGTSEVKALLISDTHQVLGSASAPLKISRPASRWSEQSPADWWDATCGVLDQLSSDHANDMRSVQGIGLSGQMHGAVLLNDNDKVLRPAILWNDGRSDAECSELMRVLPQLPELAGNLAMPGFTAPKLLWVARHEPALFERVTSVLLPKDWLRFQLTGEKVSEMSDAAGTLWLDTKKRDWSEVLLAACGLSIDDMPRLVEGSNISAYLLPHLAQRWNLPEGVPIAGGGGDNAASAVGIGAIHSGSGFLSLGTSGVIFVCNDAYRPNPQSAVHTFCHALPGRWHQMSVMLSAASCLRWVAELTGYVDEAALLAEIAALDASSRAQAPLFLPYLSGERTPHNDPHAQGVFFGLSLNHGGAHLGYAVLEGVAFGFRDGLAALQHAGTVVERLSLIGGGARSSYWAQLLADVLNIELLTHSGGELGAALGAARLGWLAAGGEENVVCIPPPIAKRYLPRPAEITTLASRYQRFRSLYPALRAQFPYNAE